MSARGPSLDSRCLALPLTHCRLHCQVPELSTFPVATDATSFQLLAGIPCIPPFGPGMLYHCYGPNEYVLVESVVQAAKQLPQ